MTLTFFRTGGEGCERRSGFTVALRPKRARAAALATGPLEARGISPNISSKVRFSLTMRTTWRIAGVARDPSGERADFLRLGNRENRDRAAAETALEGVPDGRIAVGPGAVAFGVDHVHRAAIHRHAGREPADWQMTDQAHVASVDDADRVDARLGHQQPLRGGVPGQSDGQDAAQLVESVNADRNSAADAVCARVDDRDGIVVPVGDEDGFAGYRDS